MNSIDLKQTELYLNKILLQQQEGTKTEISNQLKNIEQNLVQNYDNNSYKQLLQGVSTMNQNLVDGLQKRLNG